MLTLKIQFDGVNTTRHYVLCALTADRVEEQWLASELPVYRVVRAFLRCCDILSCLVEITLTSILLFSNTGGGSAFRFTLNINHDESHYHLRNHL